MRNLIKKILKEQDDFGWIRDITSTPIQSLVDYYNRVSNNEYHKYYVLRRDYRALYGVLRRPNRLLWESDVPHPIKDLLTYDDFKNPEIRKQIKSYYKDTMAKLYKSEGIGYTTSTGPG